MAIFNTAILPYFSCGLPTTIPEASEYIKVFVTRHDLENRHFNLAGIDFDGESYRIVEKTFEEKRPKYAICKVVKEAAS